MPKGLPTDRPLYYSWLLPNVKLVASCYLGFISQLHVVTFSWLGSTIYDRNLKRKRATLSGSP